MEKQKTTTNELIVERHLSLHLSFKQNEKKNIYKMASRSTFDCNTKLSTKKTESETKAFESTFNPQAFCLKYLTSKPLKSGFLRQSERKKKNGKNNDNKTPLLDEQGAEC